jgi:DNA primase
MTADAHREDIAALKRAHSLPQVAERHGVALRPSGGGFVGRCPFHDDRNPSFSVYLAGNGEWRFKCFGASCGLSGDVLDFAGLLVCGPDWDSRDAAQFKQALRALGAETTTGRERRRKWDAGRFKAKERQQVTPLIQLAWDAALGLYADVLQRSPEIAAYLRGRGFTEATLRRYRFGYCPPEGANLPALAGLLKLSAETLEAASLLRAVERGGKSWRYEFFSGRIVFADVNLGRQTVYLVGRKPLESQLPDSAPRYLGLANFAKPVLGAASLAPGERPAFVVEGPWDMLTLREWGYDAVAIAGAHMSDAQVEALLGLGRRLIPIRDNDPGGALAYAAWRERLPGLEAPLALPEKVGGAAIKDPNDLAARLPEGVGRKLFRDLAKKVGVEAKP